MVDWRYIAKILLSAINETRSCSEEEMYEDLISRGIDKVVLEILKEDDPFAESEENLSEEDLEGKMNPPEESPEVEK
jgi:hypothetical protein